MTIMDGKKLKSIILDNVKEKIENMAKKSQHKREMPYKFKN